MSRMQELLARAEDDLARDADNNLREYEIGTLLVRLAALAIAPDIPLVGERPPFGVAEWGNLRNAAAQWLTGEMDTIASVLRKREGHAAADRVEPLVIDQCARIAGLAADLRTSQPLAPPVTFSDNLQIPPWVPIHALIFANWPHAAHEFYPLMVDAMEATANGRFRGVVAAVHECWVTQKGRTYRAIRYLAPQNRLYEGELSRSRTIASVRLLWGPPGDERAWHERLDRLFAAKRVAVVNPYAAAAVMDDKWETHGRWLRAGVPTPPTWLIFRDSSPGERLAIATEAARTGGAVVAKPRHGTEARGVRVFPAGTDRARIAEDLAALVEASADDYLLQEFHGHLRRYADDGSETPHPATLRLHVARDATGNAVVESGYIHVADDPRDPIASLGRGGRARPIVRDRLRLVAPDGKVRPLAADDVAAIETCAKDAVAALVEGDQAVRLVGLDLVVEVCPDGRAAPFALDANPRPAGLAHSRFLAPGWDEEGEPGVSVAMWEDRE